MKMAVDCASCGTRFVRRRKVYRPRFCSFHCFANRPDEIRLTRKKPDRPCVVCGVLVPGSSARLTCSDQCRTSRRNAQERKRNPPAARREACAYCLTVFTARSRVVRFCSEACGRKARRPKKPPVACAHCGNLTTPARSGRYCGRSCQAAAWRAGRRAARA